MNIAAAADCRFRSLAISSRNRTCSAYISASVISWSRLGWPFLKSGESGSSNSVSLKIIVCGSAPLFWMSAPSR